MGFITFLIELCANFITFSGVITFSGNDHITGATRAFRYDIVCSVLPFFFLRDVSVVGLLLLRHIQRLVWKGTTWLWSVYVFDQYCVGFLSVIPLLSCWNGKGLNDLLMKCFRSLRGLNRHPWGSFKQGFCEWNRWEAGIFWSISSHEPWSWLFSKENCPWLNVYLSVYMCVCEREREREREIRPAYVCLSCVCLFTSDLIHQLHTDNSSSDKQSEKNSRGIPPHPLKAQWMRHWTEIEELERWGWDKCKITLPKGTACTDQYLWELMPNSGKWLHVWCVWVSE